MIKYMNMISKLYIYDMKSREFIHPSGARIAVDSVSYNYIKGSVVDFEECPYENCGKLYINKPGLKFCPNCGQPLEVVCWNCGKTHPFTSKQKVCTNCGSNRVESTIFDNDVKAFNAKLNQASVTESELNIEYSKFENKYKQRAKTGSLVAKQLEVIRNSINKKVQDLAKRKQVYDTYVKEINASMAQKAYMKANDILLKLI